MKQCSFFFRFDVECLQTNNYPSINRPRKSKDSESYVLVVKGGQWTGEESSCPVGAPQWQSAQVGSLCVLLVRLLRVGKEGIHTGVQAPQKAPAAVGPRPYSDEERPVIVKRNRIARYAGFFIHRKMQKKAGRPSLGGLTHKRSSSGSECENLLQAEAPKTTRTYQ